MWYHKLTGVILNHSQDWSQPWTVKTDSGVCASKRVRSISLFTLRSQIFCLKPCLLCIPVSPCPPFLPRPSDSRTHTYCQHCIVIFSCCVNMKYSVYWHRLLASIVVIQQSVASKCCRCTSYSLNTHWVLNWGFWIWNLNCRVYTYRIARNFGENFNLVNWRIFYLITKINSAKHASLCARVWHT